MSALLATATAAKAGSTVTAVVNGVTTAVQVARDLTVASGDVLVVERIAEQWFALGRAYAAAPAVPINETPPASQPASVSGTTVFGPVDTRTYESSWRTDNTSVYQGSYGGSGNRTGCVFYGAPPRSLSGATITSAYFQVRRQAGGAYAAQTATMRLMTNATRPAGAPTLTSSTAGPYLPTNTQGQHAVPASWVQSMVDGTAGGLAFFIASGSPYMVFSGYGDWSPAFNLTVNWTR